MAKRKKGKSTSLITTLLVLLIAAGSFCYSYFTDSNDGFLPTESDVLSVYYIDVGQGDCELIVCENHSVLIDAGEAENANKVIQFIGDLGIKKLDCIVSTHPHSDHAGALSYIIEAVGADEIIMPELTEANIPTTKTYERLMNVVIDSGAAVHAAKPGQHYQYGDIAFDIYSPVFEESSELNNMSVVFRLVYGNTSFLFTGDAEKQVEKQLLADHVLLKSDVVKMPHHGSKTSSTEAFVKAVSPTYAVVCCGDGTKNHPHADITARWEAVGAQIFRTDYNGTVKITTDGDSLRVETERQAA